MCGGRFRLYHQSIKSFYGWFIVYQQYGYFFIFLKSEFYFKFIILFLLTRSSTHTVFNRWYIFLALFCNLKLIVQEEGANITANSLLGIGATNFRKSQSLSSILPTFHVFNLCIKNNLILCNLFYLNINYLNLIL